MIKRLLILGAAALTLGAVVRLSVAPVAAGSALFPRWMLWTGTGVATPYRWEPVWSVPAPHLTAMAMTSDGNGVAWIDRDGVTRRIGGETGNTLWQTPAYPGIDRIQISRKGMVLVYSRSGERGSLRLLDADVGAGRSAVVPLEGTVEVTEVTPDSSNVLVGSASSRLYVVPMRSDAAWGGRPMQLPGIPTTLQTITSDSGIALTLCGTRQGDLLGWSAGSDTPTVWEAPTGRARSVREIEVSQDGNTAAVVFDSTGAGRPWLEVWDVSRKKRLWATDIEGFTPRVFVSGNGRLIALNYTRNAPMTDGGVAERKVALFDRTGKRFNERGGVSFSPEILAVSSDGSCLTVRDPAGNLWLLDSAGHTIARLRAPKSEDGTALTLKSAETTPDGAYLLLHYAGNGESDRLALYRFAQPAKTPVNL